MSAQHTPGPWVVDRDASGNGISTTIESNRFWITGVIKFPGPGFSDEANARLIAAAPELLEALCLLLDRIESPDGLPMKKARAAIAKATGEQA